MTSLRMTSFYCFYVEIIQKISYWLINQTTFITALIQRLPLKNKSITKVFMVFIFIHVY